MALRSLSWMWLAAVVLAAARARAETPPKADGAGNVFGERWIRFRADRLELDPKLERLDLAGRVVVSVDRYRLTSEKLTLERSPRGMVVGGGGRVAFCPCPEPPVTLGFRSALVAPPTDLLLEQPTVRVAGVPVFWLPYLWLRSPDRVGLLPLQVAYRGGDGALLGSGIHLPLGGDRLDVAAAGYVKGGVDVSTRLTTPRTSSVVRWDYLNGGLLAADLRGAENPVRDASVAWSVDALRGQRALGGPVLLEEAARRQDRARAAAGFSDGTWTVGATAIADSRRGGSVGAVGAGGPGFHAGFGGALGRLGAVNAAMDVATLRLAGGAGVTAAAGRTELRTDGALGPLALSLEGRSRAVVAVTETGVGHTAAAGGSAEVSAPFVKELGTASAGVEHWVTPFVSGGAGVVDTQMPSVLDPLARDGTFYTVSAGVRTTLGTVHGDRSAVALAARAGALGEGSEVHPAVSGTVGGRARYLAARAEVVHLGDASRGSLAVGTVRVGSESGPFLGGRMTALDGRMPVLARFFMGGWDAPWAPWMDRAGLGAGGELGIPWTPWLGTRADVDYDVTNRTLLGARGNVGYLHPCGCLAVALWGGKRLGRPGVDSWLTVDLVP